MTETLRLNMIDARNNCHSACEAYELALKQAFPVQVGDAVQDEADRGSEVYRIENLYVIYSGNGSSTSGDVKVEVRKKTKAGWHKTKTIVGGLSHRIVSGRAVKVNDNQIPLRA